MDAISTFRKANAAVYLPKRVKNPDDLHRLRDVVALNAMTIPKYFIEQVKDAIRLSELIGRYVPLKRAGKEFGGLCPFHSEKTPSFTVNDDKGFYHCFGCQAHGDAIGFMIAHERMNYVEAIKYLAGTVGMDVPEETDEAREQEDRRAAALAALEAACKWYQSQFMNNSGMGARSYTRNRGLGRKIVEQFRIGYAPAGRYTLKTALLAEGHSHQSLLDAGLLVQPETGDTYDRFRDRLMFPIFHKRGQVVAFGGRLLAENPESKAPKYLNSSETLVFKKRDMLYHLHEAAVASRESKRLIVVEGYMDVIGCAAYGIEDAVATLGTAFTTEHVQALWAHVDEPVMCLDGDSAGSRAMLRSAELILPMLVAGKSFKFAIMPKGEDPDSLLKRSGRAAFEQIMAQAIGLHEALFNSLSHNIDMRDPSQRASLEKKLEGLSSRITDNNVRQHFRNFFRETLWAHAKKPANKSGKSGGDFKAKGEKVQRLIATPATPADRLMRAMLKLLLKQPELLLEREAEHVLEHMHCHAQSLERIRQMLLVMVEEHTDIHQLPEMLHAGGLHEEAEKLMQDNGLLLPKNALESVNDARTILLQWMAQAETLALEAEYAALVTETGSDGMSDEDMQRLLTLQQEIQARKIS